MHFQICTIALSETWGSYHSNLWWYEQMCAVFKANKHWDKLCGNDCSPLSHYNTLSQWFLFLETMQHYTRAGHLSKGMLVSSPLPITLTVPTTPKWHSCSEHSASHFIQWKQKIQCCVTETAKNATLTSSFFSPYGYNPVSKKWGHCEK